MNKLLEALIRKCNVRFKPTLHECNYYWGVNDAGERIVYMNVFNNNLLLIAKAIWGRPLNGNHTVAHEVGHAFFDMFGLDKHDSGREIFGDYDKPYRETWGLVSSFFHPKMPEFPSKYAYEHPCEDFAECFAIMVLNNNVIPEVTNETLRRKYEYIQKAILSQVILW